MPTKAKKKAKSADAMVLTEQQAEGVARAVGNAVRAKQHVGSVSMGFVTQSGGFINTSHGGLRVIDKNADKLYQRFAYKASMTGEDAPAQQTELHEADDPFNYDTDGVITPPFPYEVLSALMTTSVVHASAIETKASDYSSSGYTLEVVPEAEDLVDEDTIAAARAECEAFLQSLADGKPIDDLVHDLAIDWESLGICAFEGRRTRKAFLAACNHIPATGVRVLLNKKEAETGCRYLQRRFNKKVFFAKFGSIVEYSTPTFDPFTAEIDEFPLYEQREQFIRFKTDRPSREGKRAKNTNNPANEMYFIARPPLTLSQVYGTPAGITALQAMLAQLRIDAYNLAFFASKGVPAYAVILEGLSAPVPMQDIADGQGDDADEQVDPIIMLETAIKEYFTNKLVQSDRSVAVFTMYGEAKLRFEKLQSDNAEAAFENYEKRVTEMVRLAHRTPGAALGILETANLGSGRDTSQLRRYRDHIVARGQREFANMVNTILRVGLLIPYFRFKFNPMEVEEEQTQKDFLLKEFIAGAISLDEYLIGTGRAPIGDENGGGIHILRTSSPTMLNMDPASTLATAAAVARRGEQTVSEIGKAMAKYLLSEGQAAVEASAS